MPAMRIASTGAQARTMPAVVALLLLAGCSSVGSSSPAIPAASSPPEETPFPEARRRDPFTCARRHARPLLACPSSSFATA